MADQPESNIPKASRHRFERKPDPDARTLADLRRRYDTGEITAAGIADEIGVSVSTARKRLTQWRWKQPARPLKPAPKTPRKAPPKPRMPPATSAPAGADTLQRDATRLRKTVRDSASRNIRALDHILSNPGGDEDMDRVARILASLVKTLAELARMDASNGTPHDRGADASATGAGFDLARIKSDLVDRLVAAAAADDGAADSGEPQPGPD